MNIDLTKLRKTLEATSERWNSCFGLFKSLKFDQTINLPSISRSIDELNVREITVFDYLISIEVNKKFSPHLFSANQFKAFHDYADSLTKNIDALEGHLKTVKTNGGLKQFDSNQLSVSCDNGQNVSIKNEVESINNETDQLLIASTKFYALSEVKYTGDLSDRNAKLQDLYTEMKLQVDNFENGNENLAKTLTKTAELQKKQEAAVDESQKLKAEVDSIHKEALASQAEVKARVSTINETSNQADALKKRVNDYQSSFDSFDKQLKARIDALKKSDKDTEDFLKKNSEREAQIESLTTKADTLIKGATVVGLANSFSEAAEEFKSERDKSKTAFYLSIFVLFVCTVPLALYIFSNVSLIELPKLEFTGIASRLILLLPGIWLTKFSSRRYHIYSELHRQYSHKATVAKAIEGFKKESPEYKEQISAAAFLELHLQPTVSFEKQKENNVNMPLAELMKSVADKLFQNKK